MFVSELILKLRERSGMGCSEEVDTDRKDYQNVALNTIDMPTCASNSDEQNLHDSNADTITGKLDIVGKKESSEESSVVGSVDLENMICEGSSSVDVKDETAAEIAVTSVNDTSGMLVTPGVADCGGELRVDHGENLMNDNVGESIDGSCDGASSIGEENEVSFPAWNGNRSAPGEHLAAGSESGL
jgi:hypothetical protein